MVQCNYCESPVILQGRQRTMKNHLKLVHPEFYSAIDGLSKNDKVTSPSSIASNSSTNASSITLSLSDEKKKSAKDESQSKRRSIEEYCQKKKHKSYFDAWLERPLSSNQVSTIGIHRAILPVTLHHFSLQS